LVPQHQDSTAQLIEYTADPVWVGRIRRRTPVRSNMRIHSLAGIVGSLALCVTACAPDAADPPADAESADEIVAVEGEWRPLFDGASLAGWTNPYDWGEASVVDGEIHLTGDRKFFLVTDEVFDNFVFEGEVLMPDTMSNAGFMFRANVEPNRVFGYQAEVDPKARRWSGGLYDEGRRAWLVPAANDTAAARAFREGPGSAFDV